MLAQDVSPGYAENKIPSRLQPAAHDSFAPILSAKAADKDGAPGKFFETGRAVISAFGLLLNPG
jgi:hypothetical protein